jgi:formylglycine-generating enzyme required for sulfatase activity
MGNQTSSPRGLKLIRNFLATIPMVFLSLADTPAYGQTPIINTFGRNGLLICTNLLPSTIATVEWSPTVLGPWTNNWANPWTNLAAIVVSNRMIQVSVPISNQVIGPMFYRVRGASDPLDMALIPVGAFIMGDTLGDGFPNEPQHSVTLSAYYIDKFEVTKAKWDTVYQWAITHGYSFSQPGSGKGSNYPVDTINWFDMVKWCNARSEKELRVPAYYTNAAQTGVYRTGMVNPDNAWVKWKAGYRLPTDAEWEKAARGGAGLGGSPAHRFPWADVDTITHAQANYKSDASISYDISPTRGYHPSFQAGASPVGTFAPNGYGLYDMAGNVWELCWDWYIDNNLSTELDPRGPATGSNRLARGGGLNWEANYCRNASRAYVYPNDGAFNNNGFRTVLPVSP